MFSLSVSSLKVVTVSPLHALVSNHAFTIKARCNLKCPLLVWPARLWKKYFSRRKCWCFSSFHCRFMSKDFCFPPWCKIKMNMKHWGETRLPKQCRKPEMSRQRVPPTGTLSPQKISQWRCQDGSTGEWIKTQRWWPKKALGKSNKLILKVQEPDAESKVDEEQLRWPRRTKRGGKSDFLSVISGSRASRCPGTAWHKQQQGPIFSNPRLSEGTIHHTSG